MQNLYRDNIGQPENRDLKFTPAIGFSLFVVALVIIGILSSMTTVGAGKVKVITRMGQVTGRVLDPGFHFKAPFIEGTTTYSTKKLTYETSDATSQKESGADYRDYPVDTNTADGQQVNIYYTIRFSIDPTMADDITQIIGSEESLVEKIIKTESRVWVRTIARAYTADDLYTGRVQDFQQAVFNQISPTFAENGITLDSVGIREIRFADEYVKAIEAKQIEAVRVETEKNRAESAKFEKERKITQAEAEAETQRLLRETLSAEVLQNKFYDKWNGVLPTVIAGESNLLMNIGN
jgi:prohibitin 2